MDNPNRIPTAPSKEMLETMKALHDRLVRAERAVRIPRGVRGSIIMICGPGPCPGGHQHV